MTFLRVITLGIVGCLFLQPFTSIAQSKNKNVVNKDQKSVSSDNSSSLNKNDEQGKPNGWWFENVAAKMGEPAYTMFGVYLHGKKEGLWYKLDDQNRILAIETYKDNYLNGSVQYYENGRLSVTGQYINLDRSHSLDSIWVTDPISQLDTLVAVPREKNSVMHGVWRYYDTQTGALQYENIFRADELIRRREVQTISNSDSLYIQERIKSLPHNKKPKAKQAPRSQSDLYPKMRYGK